LEQIHRKGQKLSTLLDKCFVFLAICSGNILVHFKDLGIELSCVNYRYKVEGGTLNDMTNFYTYKPSSANHHLDQAKRHKAEGVKVAVSKILASFFKYCLKFSEKMIYFIIS
jgi:hypothetical protein